MVSRLDYRASGRAMEGAAELVKGGFPGLGVMSSRAWRGDFGVPRACAICVVGRFSISDEVPGFFEVTLGVGCGVSFMAVSYIGIKIVLGFLKTYVVGVLITRIGDWGIYRNRRRTQI
jgi:hypothetical protein